MKIRSLLISAFVLLVLAGALYWSDHRKPSAEAAKSSSDTPPAILKLDESAITHVELKNKDSEPIVLAKNSSGQWKIEQPKPLSADQASVNGVISSLSSLNSERLIEDKATDLKQYGLDQPAVEVDVTEKDNKSQKLLIGDETPTGSAVYAMLSGDPRIFTMASYNKSSIDKSVNDLRDKRLVTVDPDKISHVDLDQNNKTIEFGRNQGGWQILKPEPLRADNFQVNELVRKLTGAQMDLSGSESAKEAAEEFAKGTPVAIAKVTDPSGTEELQVRKHKTTYYAKSSAVEGTYKVNADLGEELAKSLDEFRNKKLFDFGYNQAAKIEIHNGTKAYYLTKSGSDWWSDGKKMDAGSVQSLVSDLSELTADKFVQTGFSSPTIELTVNSDESKHIEKVSIAKSGSGYLAKREGEPTLYNLNSTVVDELLKAASDLKPASPSAKK
jgi:hypothetical protein